MSFTWSIGDFENQLNHIQNRWSEDSEESLPDTRNNSDNGENKRSPKFSWILTDCRYYWNIYGLFLWTIYKSRWLLESDQSHSEKNHRHTRPLSEFWKTRQNVVRKLKLNSGYRTFSPRDSPPPLDILSFNPISITSRDSLPLPIFILIPDSPFIMFQNPTIH